MAKDFYENFAEAREVFEEGDDRLNFEIYPRLSFKVPIPFDREIIERNSQTGIYVASLAIWRVLKKLFPELRPAFCAGLSLGEYTALTASGRLSFEDGLPLVQRRGQFMNDACEATKGTMAVILGLDAETVETLVKEVNRPNDLWAVISIAPGKWSFQAL